MPEKINVTEVIRFVGVNDLNATEKTLAKKLSNEYYDKIKRSLRNLTSMVVQIKKLGKGGKAEKYSVHARVIAPTVEIEADKAADYDFARTLHKAFKDLERQIEHKLHTDDQKIKQRVGSKRKHRIAKFG